MARPDLPNVTASLRTGLCLPHSLELPEAKAAPHPIKAGFPKTELSLPHEFTIP